MGKILPIGEGVSGTGPSGQAGGAESAGPGRFGRRAGSGHPGSGAGLFYLDHAIGYDGEPGKDA